MGDESYVMKTYRMVYSFEIGEIDGGGIGRWEKTLESHPFPSREKAEAYRDTLLVSGKLVKTRWGTIRLANTVYGTSRIKAHEELVI